MNIAFAGFRHDHIFGLYNTVLSSDVVNLVGCFERDENAKKQAKERKNVEFNYNTYDELINDDKVDIVAIGDYYGIRGSMIIEALKKGKHIICDKPLCTSLEELDEIEKISSEKNLQVCCMLDLDITTNTKGV